MIRSVKDQSGMTMVESMIAILILLSGLLFIAQVMVVSVMASKTLGRDAGKTTAAAHDKMEELMGLPFTDTSTNVTVAAPFSSDGVGLTAGGSNHPDTPITGYVDYLDHAGVRTTADDAAYTRQWRIINDSSSLKRIVVSVRSNESFQYGTAPSTVLVTQKAP
jgi:type II secretory pathway pseudopilin PulG